MKLFAPAYYTRFRCIADRCRHSCCVGWEIDVDEDTLQKYAQLPGALGATIRESIDMQDTPHFRIDCQERCPHLDERGLCRIILTLGEDYLSEICREHPRFYHTTAQGLEVGLGMACEEACRVILSADDATTCIPLGEAESTASLPEFDVLPHRAYLYSLLLDESLPYDERLQKIARTYHVTLSRRTDAQWRALLSSLEYMNPAHGTLYASCYTSSQPTPPSLAPLLARALAYFILRHLSPATDIDALCEALGLCLFLERLLASVAVSLGVTDLSGMIDCARTLSEELEYSEDNTAAISDAAAVCISHV